MNDIARMEKLIQEMTDLRDDQTTVSCQIDETLPCICNDFDAVLDRMRKILLKMYDSEIKKMEIIDLPGLEDPEDKYERKGVIEAISRLEVNKTAVQSEMADTVTECVNC
jgi:hypothetical protein|tara:strand:- start:1040 stop:1369 length:330 start_codon:yes stop_codon:yes gene_type:complete